MAREYFDFDSPDEREIRAEREKAKSLRKTRWWQQKTASGKCFYCEKKFPFRQITMDHLVPLARGGRSTKDNIVPCCKKCNTLKKSMMPIEWDEYREMLKAK
jgi:5-methylcytosine-specific restriction protein A